MAGAGRSTEPQLLAGRLVVGDQARAVVRAALGQRIDEQGLGQHRSGCAVVAADRRQIERLQLRQVAVAVAVAGRRHPRVFARCSC